ncbi:hypothetical protein BGZ63DRAFT_421957 [Mariannaea sp. PMI_226]|nr:hypothetical protein BGZ63DRAFT_421957 [Mariannaea sp. PMI_226]
MARNPANTSSLTDQPATSEPSTYESSDERENSPDNHLQDKETPLSLHTAHRPRRMSAHAEADADRAMRRTSNWTPIYERRQSWSNEDRKRAMHMASIQGVQTGPGFTEKVKR